MHIHPYLNTPRHTTRHTASSNSKPALLYSAILHYSSYSGGIRVTHMFRKHTHTRRREGKESGKKIGTVAEDAEHFIATECSRQNLWTQTNTEINDESWWEKRNLRVSWSRLQYIQYILTSHIHSYSISYAMLFYLRTEQLLGARPKWHTAGNGDRTSLWKVDNLLSVLSQSPYRATFFKMLKCHTRLWKNMMMERMSTVLCSYSGCITDWKV